MYTPHRTVPFLVYCNRTDTNTPPPQQSDPREVAGWMHARIIIPDLSPQHAARRDAQDRLGFQGRWFGSMCSSKVECRTSRLCHRMMIPMTTMMAFLHAKVTTTYHHHPQTRQIDACRTSVFREGGRGRSRHTVTSKASGHNQGDGGRDAGRGSGD
jgi:hypothetical protein